MCKLASEPEFEHNELCTSLAPFLEKHPEYKKTLQIIQMPERIIQFRVVWEDDKQVAQMNKEEAEAALAAGCRYVAEGSNMRLDQAAIEVFENSRLTRSTRCWYAPGKAANLGGVAVSGLEMAQNSARLTWSQEQVEAKLNEIMKNAYDNCFKTGEAFAAKEDKLAQRLPSLVAGANIAGFKKVADAMKQHGGWF